MYSLLQGIRTGSTESVYILEDIINNKKISDEEFKMLKYYYCDELVNGYYSVLELVKTIRLEDLNDYYNNIYFNSSRELRLFKIEKAIHVDNFVELEEEQIMTLAKILEICEDINKITKKYFPDLFIEYSSDTWCDHRTLMTKKEWVSMFLEIHKLNEKLEYKNFFLPTGDKI